MKSSSKFDDSDQKASKLLIDSLMKLSPPKKSPKNRKRPRGISESNQPKITTYLTKEVTSVKKRPKLQPLNINRIPTYEKILSDHKKFEKHAELVRKLDKFDEKLLDDLPADCLEVSKFSEEILDCKHLSSKQLERYFRQFSPKLRDIIAGRCHSDRHNKFHQQIDHSALMISSTSLVFTFAQKELLIELMKKEFDQEDKLDNYFFKVLLPEVCLMIFMDEHKMGKRKAMTYLDKRPVED